MHAQPLEAAGYAVVGRWREQYDVHDLTRAGMLMKQWGVEQFAHRPFGTLSEGERKRTQIARALMPDPELLLLDEPGAGLDLGGALLVRRIHVRMHEADRDRLETLVLQPRDERAHRCFIEREPRTATALLTTLQHADKDSYARVCEALGRADLRPDLAHARAALNAAQRAGTSRVVLVSSIAARHARNLGPEELAVLRRLAHPGTDVSNGPLKVVVDAGNGMAGHTAPAVFDRLSEQVEMVPMYFELDGTFPNHEANPIEAANLVDLQKRVLAEGADIGLAFDGDADRCFLVDERGELVSPSTLTALIAARELRREPGHLVDVMAMQGDAVARRTVLFEEREVRRRAARGEPEPIPGVGEGSLQSRLRGWVSERRRSSRRCPG